MNAAERLLGMSAQAIDRCDAFLRWQCLTRQKAMRQQGGRPNGAMAPNVILPGEAAPMGQVVTLLLKRPEFDKTPELMHMVRRTHDPAQRREKALQLFSETYYQKAREFSDTLVAIFAPGSPGAARIAAAGRCRLDFEAFSQKHALECDVSQLQPGDPLREAAWWHNALFNPNLSAEAVALAFAPDWTVESGNADRSV